MRGIGDQDRVQLLRELCFPFGFGSSNFVRIFCFVSYVVLVSCSTADSLNSLNQYDGQTTEDITHPLMVLKAERKQLQ